MGCGSSKVDDLAAVGLCRERCGYVEEAIRQRFALSEAHVAYLHSLKAVGISLDRFFNIQRPTENHHLHYSRSHSGSHLHFHSEEEEEEDEPNNNNNNYMISQAAPSLIYTTQPPLPFISTTQSMQHNGDPDYSHYYKYHDDPNPNPYPVYENDLNHSGASAWDFLNFPIDSFGKYYYYSKEVREEEEGIPDLEEDDDSEVVKEVVESGRTSTQSNSKPALVQEEEEDGIVAAGDETHTDKLAEEPGFKDDAEVVREIQLQFERAFESQTELLKFLEVGKLPYKQKQVILHLPPVSSPPSTSKSSDPTGIDADQELEMMSKTLSSTLHKLYLWEKKLYEEVKVEEKIRILHERKSRKLKRLDEEGVEPHKVDATRNLVRSLETKIRIAIQVVDKISVKINSLRDDELWPLLTEFIQGLTRMWKSMLECHHNQCQAIAEAKRLDAIAFHNQFSDARFEATRQLEHDLINWTLQFSYWISAQKGYVRTLNNWLMKCLLYVPEETPDGIVPFSPSRIGAPPVFVVCNQWWQSLDGISEKEVIDSMRELASNVFQLWDRDKKEMRMKMLEDKDERKIKSLDKEDQKIQKEIQALDKRMVLNSADESDTTLTGHIVYHSETTRGGSLQASLQHVLEAMERFTANSLKVYKELLQRIEEDHLAREHEKVS